MFQNDLVKWQHLPHDQHGISLACHPKLIMLTSTSAGNKPPTSPYHIKCISGKFWPTPNASQNFCLRNLEKVQKFYSNFLEIQRILPEQKFSRISGFQKMDQKWEKSTFPSSPSRQISWCHDSLAYATKKCVWRLHQLHQSQMLRVFEGEAFPWSS